MMMMLLFLGILGYGAIRVMNGSLTMGALVSLFNEPLPNHESSNYHQPNYLRQMVQLSGSMNLKKLLKMSKM